MPLAEMAAIPWYSELFVGNADDEQAPYFHLLTGPARYKRGGWCLPILGEFDREMTPDVSADPKLLFFSRFEGASSLSSVFF